MVNLGEVFRGSPHETAVREAEAGALRWQDRTLEQGEFEAEFRGAWEQAMVLIRKARINALLEKSKRQGWNSDEQAQYRLLQQALNVPASK